jgi:hypothetical protein
VGRRLGGLQSQSGLNGKERRSLPCPCLLHLKSYPYLQIFVLFWGFWTLLEASRDIGLEINAEKTKYVIMSHHPNSGQNQNIRIANESFERVAKFKYMGMTLINQNVIHDENQE